MFKRFDVLTPTPGTDAPFKGHLRVLDFSGDGQGVWLIPVAKPPRKDYMGGPKYRLISEVETWLSQLRATIAPFSMPGLWYMPDAAIRKHFGKIDEKERFATLEKRNADWELIDAFVNRHGTAEILDKKLTYRWARRRASEKRVSIRRIYRALHRYWAGACNNNALLPEYGQRGRGDKPRQQTQKLGRPNAAVKAGHRELAGYVLTRDDINKLQFGWETFKVNGTSAHDAYLETAAAFWRADIEQVDGKPRPVLLAGHQRPTEAQFLYWGPKGDGNLEAWKTQLGVNEWERNHRPLPGTVRDGIDAAGMTATMDAVFGDVQLVSVADRLQPVGTLTRITVIDSYLGYIPGFYAGFDAPSASTALQAIANAASSKVEFCSRYGITITDEDWLPMAFRKYIGDNGELRNECAMETIPGWGASIEYVRSGRAELKHVESDHHSSQAKVDHKLPGTNHGRRAKRGEPDPVYTAALNHYEYVRQHIKRVLFHNNKARVPHLLTLEMRNDDVEPTRLAILKWLMRNGQARLFQPAPELLRARLLPSFRAVINARGLFLYRPDRGEKHEIVRGARFVSDYLLTSGLMEKGRAKSIPVTVTADPNDISRVWYAVPEGLMEIPNVHPDRRLVEEATLRDLLQIQDDDHLAALLGKSETDQDTIDFIVERDTEAQAAVAERRRQIKASARPPTKSALKRHRRANRAVEKARLSSRGRPAKAQSKRPVRSEPPSSTSVEAAKDAAQSSWSPEAMLLEALNEARSDGIR